MTTMDEPVTNFQGNGYVSKRFSFFRVLYFRLSQGYLTILHVCVYARDSNPVIMFLFNGIFSFLFTLLQQMASVKAASCIQGTKQHTVTQHVPITEDTFNSTDHEKIPRILHSFQKLSQSHRWQASSAQETVPTPTHIILILQEATKNAGNSRV